MRVSRTTCALIISIVPLKPTLPLSLLGSALVAEMETDNLFLQAEMPLEPNGEFVVKYKNGNVPPKRQQGIDNFKSKNKQAEVKTVASKLSLKDAEARGERLMKKLEQKSFTNVSYSIDGDALELLAKMSQDMDPNGSGKVPPGQMKQILDLTIDDPDAEDLTLVLTEFEEEDPTQPLHTYGGRKISGGGYQCTTAFSVRHSSGASESVSIFARIFICTSITDASLPLKQPEWPPLLIARA